MRDASGPRPSITFLVVALGAFAFAWAIAGRHAGLWVGHDHWVTGHGMLLSDGYLRAGFRTPWLLPVEDAFGPVGTWAPYTGWPPLFFVVLAGWRAVFGPSLETARLFFCGVTAISAGLVALMALRATRNGWLVLFATVAFLTFPSLMKYSAFGFCDTGALAASLLVILLFPGYVSTGSSLRSAAYLGLVAAAGLTSWQCFVAPIACAAAYLLLTPAAPRARLLAPIAAAAVTGAALLLYYGRAEAVFEPNGWTMQATLYEKFLLRTGWTDPHEALGFVQELVTTVARGTLPVALATVALVAAAWVLRFVAPATASAAEPANADARLGVFYAAATGLQVVLWSAFMPNMQRHDFQGIFWAAPFAVAATVLVREAFRRTGALASAGASAGLLAASLALAAYSVSFSSDALDRVDQTHFAAVERDVRAVSTPSTVVVTSIEDRGFWWRVERPVIALRRIERARGRDHLVVIESGAQPPEGDYERVAGDANYAVWKPRPASSSKATPAGARAPVAPAG